MLWIIGALVLGSIAALHAARRRRRDIVFVSRTEPISVIHLRLADRRVHVRAALQDASRMLW